MTGRWWQHHQWWRKARQQTPNGTAARLHAEAPRHETGVERVHEAQDSIPASHISDIRIPTSHSTLLIPREKLSDRIIANPARM